MLRATGVTRRRPTLLGAAAAHMAGFERILIICPPYLVPKGSGRWSRGCPVPAPPSSSPSPTWSGCAGPIAREHELERTVRELERNASEFKLRASDLERERDEARGVRSCQQTAIRGAGEGVPQRARRARGDEGAAPHGPGDRHRAVGAADRQRSRVVVCAEVGVGCVSAIAKRGTVREALGEDPKAPTGQSGFPQPEVLLRGGVHDQIGGDDGKHAICIAQR